MKYHVTVTKDITACYTFEVEADNEYNAIEKLSEAWGKDGFEEMLIGESTEADYGINENRGRYNFLDATPVES